MGSEDSLGHLPMKQHYVRGGEDGYSVNFTIYSIVKCVLYAEGRREPVSASNTGDCTDITRNTNTCQDREHGNCRRE